MNKKRLARLRRMSFWELHHEHPTLTVNKQMYDCVDKIVDLFICWEGITAIHGNSPTLFEILNTLDESLRRTFLLECTIYYETHHEMGHVDVTTGTTPALEYATM